MPNLVPPVSDVAAARAYRERILAALAARCADFTPLMTCYLTDATDPDEVARGYDEGRVRRGQALSGARDDQLGATASPISTASSRCWSAWPEIGMPLLVHGEVTDPGDRRVRPRGGVHRPGARPAAPPAARIAHRARAHHDRGGGRNTSPPAAPNLAATITAHHLVINRNALFAGGIRPHLYCLPIAKREKHRLRLAPRRDLGRPAFLPRHRQRAARGPDQGDRLRLRRHLHRAVRARKSMPRCSRRKARSTGSRPSPR